MSSMKRNSIFAAILMIALLALWGCPKKTEVASAPEAQAPAAQAQKETTATEQANKAEPAQTEASKETAGTAAEGLKTVYFDYDKSVLRDEARATLKEDAAWLKAHPKAKIRIEGNCDERGTVEYNQALGQRRAASAKRYLTDLGISGKRISLISYGKEKPVCTEGNESCWQKNRRDDFTVRD